MSIAASLLMLAAAAAPQGGKPVPATATSAAPAAQPAPSAGVHATANATAVIVRGAVVRFDGSRAGKDGERVDETIYRQTTRSGRRVSVDFN